MRSIPVSLFLKSLNLALVFLLASVSGIWATEKSDIGNVSFPGSINWEPGAISISGSGSDIWGTSDAGFYYHDATKADMAYTVKILSIENTNEWAKAGIMFRENTDPGSKHVFLAVTPGNGIALQARNSTNGSSSHTGIQGSAPCLLKLERNGNTFTGYVAPVPEADTVWTEVGSVIVDLPVEYRAGMAITSHDNSQLCTAAYDAPWRHLKVVGYNMGTLWYNQDIGYPFSEGAVGKQYDNNNIITIQGGGIFIWHSNDQFHYAYKELDGNGEISVQVDEIENTNEWARAGIMIRESVADNAKYVAVFVTPEHDIVLQYRTNTAGATSSDVISAETVPVMLKIERHGSNFKTYTAAPSENPVWVHGGSVNVSMETTVTMGLAVGSNDVNTACNANFSNEYDLHTNDVPPVPQNVSSQPRYTGAGNTAHYLYFGYTNPYPDPVHPNLNFILERSVNGGPWEVQEEELGVYYFDYPRIAAVLPAGDLWEIRYRAESDGLYSEYSNTAWVGNNKPTEHTLTLEVVGNWNYVRYFELEDGTIVDHTDGSVAYTDFYNHPSDWHESMTEGATATITFTSNAIKLYARTFPYGGTGKIYIDGAYKQTVSFNGPVGDDVLIYDNPRILYLP